MRDFHNNILVKRAISPFDQGTGNTAIVSQIIDRQDYRSLEFVIDTGSLSDTDATFTVLVEDGNDSALADNATVDSTQLLGTAAGASFTFAADDNVRKIGYIGSKRYVRLTITPANNTGDDYLSAMAILANGRAMPVTQPTA